ncbi:MAG: hypothetical protein KKF20_03765 [Bacteroidetes bacterium]|nr:hypothetical protein [Bacteroidota bacterium]MBU1422767.1 hypothetical protein [Bacteroidota bacterium]MBU2471506.1 hypothetical protein [Bacteroidota bacterium]
MSWILLPHFGQVMSSPTKPARPCRSGEPFWRVVERVWRDWSGIVSTLVMASCMIRLKRLNLRLPTARRVVDNSKDFDVVFGDDRRHLVTNRQEALLI